MSELALKTAPSGPFAEGWALFRRNRAALFGLVLLAAIGAMTAFGPLIYPVDPLDIVSAPLQAPGQDGLLLGTDYLGRDLLAGIISGGRASLAVGLSAAILTMLLGVTTGALAGFYGGWVDRALMRVTEFFQVLPPLILAMTIVLLFRPSLASVVVSIGLVSWPTPARLTRAEFLRIRELDYVKAARSLGATDIRIILRLILPNAAPPLIVAATLTVGAAILFEGGLSFLGLGDSNAISWGLIMGVNRPYMLDAWWTTALPGTALFLTVLAVGLVGSGLNDALNPRLRER
jgi:peptide/nickel transport system permease protein